MALLKIFDGSFSLEDFTKFGEVGAAVGEFLKSRCCDGVVDFIIESRVYNRQYIESKERELSLQQKNLAMKKRELEESKEKRTLIEAIQREIDIVTDHIDQMQKLKAFQEAVEQKLGEEVGLTPPMTLEQVIERCKPIVMDFFQQKNGIMEEFLRVASTQPEESPLDITTLFNECADCAEQLEQFFTGFKVIFDRR